VEHGRRAASERRDGPPEGAQVDRRSLTEEEQHKIAAAIVEHLEQSNWKIEQGPPREGHAPHLMSK
jgi:hypothetical protein